MTPNEQLTKWVEGTSVHDYDYADGEGQCCPDFSCCGGEIADKALRERFAAAFREGDDEAQWAILSGFLSGVLSDKGINAHIAGSPVEEH